MARAKTLILTALLGALLGGCGLCGPLQFNGPFPSKSCYEQQPQG